MRRTATTALLAIGGTALAQPAITIEVDNPVLMPGESTLVTMFAGFDSSEDYAMGGLTTDLAISTGSEGWSGAELVFPMAGPGTDPGVRSPAGYDEIIAGQVHHPFEAYFADATNPIAFWQATYTAPIDVAAPFDVDLTTATTRYAVYVDMHAYLSVSRLDDLTEGAATIRVIPAPASALVLAGGVLAMRRRR
ncbi:MAG: hypothetical protein RIE77_05005 [Phycisphaerales bacterium]|jgi:hypothetical protein